MRFGENDRPLIAQQFWLPPLTCAILLVAILIYSINVYHYHQERWDDAYISFRFAQHVAEGRGLIWNVGKEPVEGYTSLLQVFLLAGGIKIGIPPEVSSFVIGVISVLMTTGMMVMIIRRQMGHVHWMAALVLGMYLADKATAIHSSSGMETQLFVLFLCGAYFLGLSFVDLPRWPLGLGLGLMIFLSILCRPEGVLFGSALYGVAAVYSMGRSVSIEDKRKKLFYLGTTAAIIVLLGFLYAWWKLSYFGYILPNSYYVKSGKISLEGLFSVLLFLTHVALWFAPLILSIAFSVNKEMRQELVKQTKKSTKIFLLTLVPAFLALAYYSTIIHEMGMVYRFSYPTYFYLIIAVAIFASLSARFVLIPRENRVRIAMIVIIWPLILIILQGSFRISPKPVSEFYQYHFEIASALKESGIRSGGTILCDAAGIIPYISSFSHVDRVGLTDNFLSGRSVATPEEREEYLWASQADVYVGYEPPARSEHYHPKKNPGLDPPYVSEVLMKHKLFGVESRIFAQKPELLFSRMKELRDNWYWVGELKWPGQRIWNLKSFVYVRKDSPYAEILIRVLRKIIAVEPEQVDLNGSGDDGGQKDGVGGGQLMRETWRKLILNF